MKKLLSLVLSLLVVSHVAANDVTTVEQEQAVQEGVTFALNLKEKGLTDEQVVEVIDTAIKNAEAAGTTLSLRNSEKATYFVLGGLTVLAVGGITYAAMSYFGKAPVDPAIAIAAAAADATAAARAAALARAQGAVDNGGDAAAVLAAVGA